MASANMMMWGSVDEGKSIFAHDPGGKVAEAYKKLTREVIKLEKQREKSRASLSR